MKEIRSRWGGKGDSHYKQLNKMKSSIWLSVEITETVYGRSSDKNQSSFAMSNKSLLWGAERNGWKIRVSQVSQDSEIEMATRKQFVLGCHS